jgi:hypothetical protein
MIKQRLQYRHYADLIIACRHLEQEGYIEISSSKPGRGKPEKFYRITKEGVKLLLSEKKEDMERFWRLLIEYSLNKDTTVKADEVDEIYNFFIKGHFKYSGRYEYFLSQLDIFNEMCMNWISENHNTEEVNLAQKILEILALNPSLTLEELAMKAGTTPKKIEGELAGYPYEKNLIDNPFFIEDEYDEAHYDRDALNQRISDWMKKTVFVRDNLSGGKTTYSLSIYGLMLVFTLLRYYESEHKVKDLFLFNKQDFSLQDSYDKIVINYKDLFPLIFGKWDLLKTALEIISVYNFDVIIDKNRRSSMTNTFVVLGGNKEYYDSICGIRAQTYIKLRRFYYTGMSVLSELSKEDMSEKINEVRRKLYEISILLGFTRDTHMTMSGGKETAVGQFGGMMVGSMVERAMEYEITILYYLALNQEIIESFRPPLLNPIRFYETLQRLSLKKRLYNILNKSEEVKLFYVVLLTDCNLFHIETANVMFNSRPLPFQPISV